MMRPTVRIKKEARYAAHFDRSAAKSSLKDPPLRVTGAAYARLSSTHGSRVNNMRTNSA
jgi:hypothetical protein